jgi:hypothetical protein
MPKAAAKSKSPSKGAASPMKRGRTMTEAVDEGLKALARNPPETAGPSTLKRARSAKETVADATKFLNKEAKKGTRFLD